MSNIILHRYPIVIIIEAIVLDIITDRNSIDHCMHSLNNCNKPKKNNSV